MKKLIVLTCLSLAGCAQSIAPTRTYKPEWCLLNCWDTPTGERIYLYVGTNGACEMRIVGKDGSEIATEKK